MCRIYLGHCIAPVGFVCVCVCWWGARDQQVQLEHETHAACYDVIDNDESFIQESHVFYQHETAV